MRAGGAGPGTARVRVRRGSGCECGSGNGCECGSGNDCVNCGFLATSDVCSRCKDPVGASEPSLKHPNTPMSDNLPKMRIHFVENTYLMQNIVIRCVFYP